MIPHYEVKQNTEEWLRMKWGKIGGTLCKGLFVKSDTLLIELLSELTEEFQMDVDAYVSPEMLRGVELEPLGRKQLSDYIGVELKECGWLQCEEFPMVGISPDGISEDLTISGEIKCPQSKKHMGTILSGEIPSDNIHQCLHYFTVNPKLEKHYFASFRPESIKPLFVKCLTRDSLIDLGTKSKPQIKSVRDWSELAKSEIKTLSEQIEEKMKGLRF